MNNSIIVAGTEISKIEYRGQQVVTYAMIDKVHERLDGTAKDAFSRNKSRFVQGEDYHDVTRRVWPTDIEWPFEKNAPSGRLFSKRGYLKLTKTLTDDRAWEVQGEMIERYFAVEAAIETLRAVPTDKSARETRLFMRQALQIAGMLGLGGNQRLIAANRSTRKATGFDYLAEMGVAYLEAPQQETLLNATDIGKALGAISAMRVNHILAENGFQTGGRDSKNRTYWEPTEKGIKAGGVMVDTERSNKTGQARQLRWASSIIEVLRELIGEAA